jgi:molecular chaperone HtpG
MSEQKLEFQAEVAKLLDIVVHSLYSHKEIFLRELISNASDACDKLRYLSLTENTLAAQAAGLKIVISIDKKARSVTVADNGIGMTRDEAVGNLGTIARSDTTAFLESLTGDERKDAALIGQFGVGFYSAFSVAKRVEVVTRKAGTADPKDAWLWASEGGGAFTISEAERPGPGTSVTVFLAKGESEFLEEHRIRHIVKTYSDHIPLPIVLEKKKGEEPEQLNSGSALWTRPKSDVTEDQYKEFYHHVGHVFDDPWLTLHNRAEGKIEYTNLLFVPTMAPYDLMHPDRKHRVKLYVKRVFITDDCEDLMPSWLRFVRGVVDSEDLPLNVSREMLQHNLLVAKIRAALVKRVLGELKKRAAGDPADYARFWDAFGAVLKEGIYEDSDYRDEILALARFHSTAMGGEGVVSLADYVNRMKDGQDAIYYIAGDHLAALRASPQLEGFHARGVEVLLFTDPIDEFWVPVVASFNDKPFKSVTSGGIDLSRIAKGGDGGDAAEFGDAAKDEAKPDGAALAHLVVAFKSSLGDAVKDVRVTDRLTDSAVCLVADEGDMDLHLERMLKLHGHIDLAASTRILEVNPTHPLIKKLGALAEDETKGLDLADAAFLLLDQARIAEGEKIADPAAFAKRLNQVLEKGLGA